MTKINDRRSGAMGTVTYLLNKLRFPFVLYKPSKPFFSRRHSVCINEHNVATDSEVYQRDFT